MNDKKAKQLRKLAKQINDTPLAYDIQEKNVHRNGMVFQKFKVVVSPLCQRGVYRALKKHAKGVSNGKM